MAYQSTILSANSKHFPEAWLAYDREFLHAASLEPTKPWDVIDPNMWQLNMTGKSRHPCSSCRTIHPPRSRSCLFRPSRGTRGSSPSQFTSDGKEICRNYNNSRCHVKECKWAHVCSSCEGLHQRPRAGAPSSPWTDAKHQSNERPAPLLACTYPPPPLVIYEQQSEKIYLSPKYSKMIFFQKSDYTSLNCRLVKFDSNVMMVNG